MKRIEKLKEGSGDTMLSASRANELIDAINSLLNILPGKGIKISKADSGFVVELDDALQEGLALKGDGAGGSGVEDGQGPGALRWRGDWSATKSYKRNDIVIKRSDADFAVGIHHSQLSVNAGTYIALKDVDPGIAATTTGAPSEPGRIQSDYADPNWATFATGNWDTLDFQSVPNPGNNITIDPDVGIYSANGFTGNLTGTVTGTVNGNVLGGTALSMTKLNINANVLDATDNASYGTVIINNSSIPAGESLQVRLVDYTYSGIDYQRYFVCSETL